MKNLLGRFPVTATQFLRLEFYTPYVQYSPPGLMFTPDYLFTITTYLTSFLLLLQFQRTGILNQQSLQVSIPLLPGSCYSYFYISLLSEKLQSGLFHDHILLELRPLPYSLYAIYQQMLNLVSHRQSNIAITRFLFVREIFQYIFLRKAPT